MRRPIVLIGLPGAGKTTTAPHVARLLGAPWCDLDARVVATAGQPVADIFAAHGEPHFRTLERAALAAALTEPAQVIATGGGWAAEPGNVAGVSDRAFVVYLSLSPADAARRLHDVANRPLLAEAPLVERIAALLATRERWYRLAHVEIASGRATPGAIASEIADAARRHGGW